MAINHPEPLLPRPYARNILGQSRIETPWQRATGASTGLQATTSIRIVPAQHAIDIYAADTYLDLARCALQAIAGYAVAELRQRAMN